MKKTAIIAVIAVGTAGGQTAVFQQAESMRMVSAGPVTLDAEAPAVAGSPFSATQTRNSLQVLGDGTRIERTENSEVSRDSEGRTRIETSGEPVRIDDPVAQASYSVDVTRKTAMKGPRMKALSVAVTKMKADLDTTLSATVAVRVTTRGDGTSADPVDKAIAETESQLAQLHRIYKPDYPDIRVKENRLAQLNTEREQLQASKGPSNASAAVTEHLGVQSVNGVQAKGTRTTITIPIGEIGNDREIRVVSERWYSDELQMVVKSSNSDPRFGTTTVELTGISRSEPSASLFQVPPDYTITEPGRAMTIRKE
jgi:hypothetical protein